ncbi:binding-protein-dependent transport systems inner membrane component [Stackebrandtia nassauensis DSM 44728]|uniref:Binding-protein-dependent transport systems inner membrane component n=1 Tax=Stackebrandtia nassauensis (strain DSM 44728 / CIP 108903 / NRRL B-16338 / NBRC 102104 / LLR-40K-21) TaxID=446470 RepID=D3QB30_STANL|nr:binding-protein-dependent transport systems inner membrane component [Stackebrandtia nassauensis DSM 44728]
MGRLLFRLRDSYVLRRIGRAVFTVWVVVTGVFFMVRLLPGNPVSTYISKLTAEGMDYETAAAAAASLYTFDPNTPIWQQYLDYLWGVCRLDFGTTLSQIPVTEKIADHLPWTLFSVGLALLLAVIAGLLLGMAMAYRRGGILDHTASALGSTMHAIPNYLVALIIVTVGATQLGLFDYADMRGTVTPGVEPSFSPEFLGDALYHAILPVFTYFITTAGTWALLMKASTTQVLGEDYVMVARARGLGGRRIGSSYVGRNAVLPVVAQIATKAGFVVGGAIFVELIFDYEGVGITLYNAINTRDYALTQGILLIITMTVIFSNLVADLTYGVLDPRIRTSGKEVER